jgi:cytochrome c oxidase cbb3-type subunit 3/ubiquinol-cytochrome c reductase cytochrome c subunit
MLSPRARARLGSRCILLAALAGTAACVGGGRGNKADDRAGDGSAEASGPAPSTAAVAPSSLFPLPPSMTGDAGALVSAERGRELYGKYCNFCHGDQGKGYAADEAPALANDDVLTLASDAFLEGAILRGRPGTTMSAWSASLGGPVGTSEAVALVSFLRTWQTKPLALADDRQVAKGDAARGAKLFASTCASCHGKEGQGGKYNAVANPELLASASDGFLATTIERGREGTPMKGFGGKLSPEQISDLVAALRSWQKPPDTVALLPPKPGGLKDVVIHPRGGSPKFEATADFIPIDTVKKELDNGASMVILDARAPADYARMHVAGALSVPYYDAEKYAPQIPKDRWILTYCACPHAASVKLRDAMRKLGYTKVAVLDEGILAWRERGYPTRGGPLKP